MADTGFLSPSTMAQGGSGPTAWSNPSNAATSNNTYATFINVSGSSSTLTATNFGASVPSGATINGIEVTIERKSSGASVHKDFTVQLVKGGTASGTNKADTATFYGTTDATITYGGASDLWGNTLTVSDVNATNFGVVFQCNNTASSLGTCSVDAFSLKIYYTTTTSYTLTISQGTVTYTGQSVGLKISRKLTVAKGTVTYAGQSVSMHKGYTLTVAKGTITYTGQTVGMRISRKVAVSHGSIAYTGQIVTMTKGALGQTLTVSKGTITYVGQSVGMRVGRKLTVAKGTITYTGQSVGLFRGRKLTVANGTITYSGQAVTLKVGRKLTVARGLITYTGQAVTLRKSGYVEYVLTVSPAVMNYVGQSVVLRVVRSLSALPATIAYIGQAVGISLGGLYDHEAEICKEVFDMATAVGICNKALGMAGASNTILSLAEASPMAMACNSYYDDTRLEMTQAISWAFCRRQQRLALLGAEAGTTENPDGASQISEYGWKYTYAYPCDCLEPILIIPSSEGVIATNYSNTGDMRDGQNTTVPFVESTWSNGAGAGYRRIISTNKQNAILVYQANITDPSVFPPDFVSLLTLTLAGKLATFLGNERIAVRLIQQASTIMEQLRHRHSLEYNTDRRPVIYTPSSDYVNVR